MPMMLLVTPSRAARSRLPGGGAAPHDDRRIAVATARSGRCIWTPKSGYQEPARPYGTPQGEGLSVCCAEIRFLKKQAYNPAGGIHLQPEILERRGTPVSRR